MSGGVSLLTARTFSAAFEPLASIAMLTIEEIKFGWPLACSDMRHTAVIFSAAPFVSPFAALLRASSTRRPVARNHVLSSGMARTGGQG